MNTKQVQRRLVAWIDIDFHARLDVLGSRHELLIMRGQEWIETLWRPEAVVSEFQRKWSCHIKGDPMFGIGAQLPVNNVIQAGNRAEAPARGAFSSVEPLAGAKYFVID